VNEERKERNERWQEEMLQFYYDIAMGKTAATPNQIAAATHLLNRLDGLPVVKTDKPTEGVKIIIEGGLPPRPQ
jgi:hypothetical protein